MRLIKAKDIWFYYITTPEELDKCIEAFRGQKLIGGDTEVRPLFDEYGERATALDPHTSQIRTIQVNYVDNKIPYVIDVLKLGVEEAKRFVMEILMQEDVIKVFHNLDYDLRQFKSTFDVWLPSCRCTKVAMQRIGLATGFKSSQIRGHSYKALSRDLFDVTISKVEADSEWWVPDLREEQLEYAALDVGAPINSGHYSFLIEGWLWLLEVIEADPPNGYGGKVAHDLDQACIVPMAKAEYTGMPVSTEVLKTIRAKAEVDLETYKLKVCKQLGLPAQQSLVFTETGPVVKVIISEQITKLLNNPKGLVELINKKLVEQLGHCLDDLKSQTLEKALKELQEEESEEEDLDNLIQEDEDEDEEKSLFKGIELIEDLLMYKTLVKSLGTNYLDLINPKTGCLHSSYQVIGASTGRMSSGGGKKNYTFNAQQISKVEFSVEASAKELFVSDSIIV